MLARTMSPRERVGQLLVRAATFVAIVAVAGGIGVALGFALTTAADDEGDTLIGTDTQARTTATTAARGRPVVTTPTRTAAPAPHPATTTPTSTTTSTSTTAAPGSGPLADVDVRVLGAILRPAGTPSGRQRRRSRITMRVRAENRGARTIRLELPVLRVGSRRIHPDANVLTPESRFGTVAARAAKAVTLRFELVGDATDKATRDRRARIEIAGRSLPLRIKIGAPVAPKSAAATPPGAAAAPPG
jgi:hypothetical protein